MNDTSVMMLAGFATGFLLSGTAVLLGCVLGFTAHIWAKRVRRALERTQHPYTADYPG